MQLSSTGSPLLYYPTHSQLESTRNGLLILTFGSLLLTANTTDQPPTLKNLFTAPGCKNTMQVGPADPLFKFLTSTNDSCIAVPTPMTGGVLPYVSFRTYFSGTIPSSRQCMERATTRETRNYCFIHTFISRNEIEDLGSLSPRLVFFDNSSA